MSLERYIAIMYPFKQRMTPRQCYFVITLTWLLAFGTPLPTAIVSKVVAPVLRTIDGDKVIPFVEESSTYVTVRETMDSNTSNTILMSHHKQSIVIDYFNSTFHIIDSPLMCYEVWPHKEKQRFPYSMIIMFLQYFIPLAVLSYTYVRIVIVIWLKEALPHGPIGTTFQPQKIEDKTVCERDDLRKDEKRSRKSKSIKKSLFQGYKRTDKAPIGYFVDPRKRVSNFFFSLRFSH